MGAAKMVYRTADLSRRRDILTIKRDKIGPKVSRDTSRAHAAFGGRDTVPPRDKSRGLCPADRKISATVGTMSLIPSPSCG